MAASREGVEEEGRELFLSGVTEKDLFRFGGEDVGARTGGLDLLIGGTRIERRRRTGR